MEKFPDEPGLQASLRADAAYAEGGLFAFGLWQRVAGAIRELRRGKAAGDATN
jgi:hypothetical protein